MINLKQLTLGARILISCLCIVVIATIAAPYSSALAQSVKNNGGNLSEPDVGVQTATSDQLAESIGGAVQAVSDTITQAFDSLIENEGLKSGGKTITYTLFAIVFAWNLLRSMVQGDGVNGIVSELVPMIGTLAIITALLESGGVGEIIKFMDSVASTFGASGKLGPDILAAIKKGLGAIANILTMPSTNTNVPFTTNIGQMIGVAGAFLVSLIAKLIAAFVIVISIGIYVANIVLAHGSIILAVALAPIMIPFMLAPALSFIFDGWLRFTLGAGMIKVVGAFMIGFTDKIMDGLVGLSSKVAVPPNADYSTIYASSLVVYCGLVLMAGLCAYLMMQVPSLATGLLSGSAGAGFRGMRALTGGVGFQAGGAAGRFGANATNKGAAGAGNVAQGAYGAVRSHRKNGTALKSESKPVQTPSERYGRAGGAAYRGLGGKMQ